MATMKNLGRSGIVIITILASISALPAQDSSKKPKELAKMYEEGLQGMMGQTFGKTLSLIDDWEFKALDAWEAESPTAKEVTKHNRSRIKFSKKEIQQIFGTGGMFRVVVYNKLVEKDGTKLGAIDGMGMTASKDVSFEIERYSVIRVVFRDDVLIDFRVWPLLDQSAMSGGTFLRR